VYLKPHNSSGTGFEVLNAAVLPFAAGATGPLDFDIDPDFHETGRAWVGYETPCGWGVRGRYWQYDHQDTDATTIVAGTPVLGLVVGVLSTGVVFHSWDVQTADLEFFDHVEVCGWEATWAAGIRYVEYEEERGIIGLTGALPLTFTSLKYFSGFGPTFALDFRRQLGRNLGVYANFRSSILMDDETNALNVNVGGIIVVLQEEQLNVAKNILETQIGAEYSVPMCGGGYYFARVGLEWQYWNDFGVPSTGVLIDETSGFAGFVASVGINR